MMGTVRGTEQEYGGPAVWAAMCLLGCHPTFEVMWNWAQLWLGVCLLCRLGYAATVARSSLAACILKACECLCSAASPTPPLGLCQENISWDPQSASDPHDMFRRKVRVNS